jgi:RNA polymerase sigma factor (sigma-70 family)
MTENRNIDHLFRHQSGKMVSVLTRIFGLQHLETVEDAVQDTFIKAAKTWGQQPPDNPQGWLTVAAKNRVLDLFRKLKADKERLPKVDFGTAAIALDELFLDHEIEDSQLRMIFTACNPVLDERDQIAFALKTISGFSTKEIAAALLLKDETVKKRLSRARKTISERDLRFEIPTGAQLKGRLDRALSAVYLIFNEGFHSAQQEQLIRKDLCAEAVRLVKIILNHPSTNHPNAHALFALFCFHSARLDSKVNEKNEVVSLKDQDRSIWNQDLIYLGNAAMYKAVETEVYSAYHFEAAIASEHLLARTYADTNWKSILNWYERLNAVRPSVMNTLSRAVVQLQLEDYESTKNTLDQINPKDLEQREYLYYGLQAEYYAAIEQGQKALEHIDHAIELVTNQYEKDYLTKKRKKLTA